MKITNIYGLPNPIVELASRMFRKPKEDEFTVSELILPSWIRMLKLKHWEDLEEDVSNCLWAILGQSIHGILSQVNIEDALQEEGLSVVVDGVTIKGRVDIYNGTTKTIEDYKVTSVYSFLLGEKPEWIAQLNLYAFLFRENGFEVEKLKIHAILRDFQVGRAENHDDYPSIPFMTVELPLWEHEETLAYIRSRLEAHRNPTPCTPEERWARGEKYAVIKKGRKTALRLFDSREEAEKYISTVGSIARKDLEIEYRPPRYIRCERYCLVRNFCKEKQISPDAK